MYTQHRLLLKEQIIERQLLDEKRKMFEIYWFRCNLLIYIFKTPQRTSTS